MSVLTPRGPMPDVAHDTGTPLATTLDRVGMGGIEVPVRLRGPDGGMILAPARADAYVSLDDPQARGIHMSRLFLSLQAILGEQELDLHVVEKLLHAFVGSHHGLSSRASLDLRFDLLVRRAALVSANSSWRTYPVRVGGELGPQGLRLRLSATVAYSSTCPCSAALARQLIQERFRDDFRGRGQVGAAEVEQWLGRERSIAATPHSQRSYAEVTVVPVDAERAPALVEVIDLAEGTLRTAVQAAVKREDEQEFARLNGANLMFCEDAGRRLKVALEADARIADWRIEARHVESLHPHDAVSIAVKGVAGGLRP